MDKMFDRLIATEARYNELDELLSSDEVINDLNKKETNYIGVELEYPIIFKDSNISSAKSLG